MFDSFEELARDTKDKVLGFGITSNCVLAYFDRCIRELKPVIEAKGIVFSLDTALKWLDDYMAKTQGLKEEYKRSLGFGLRRTIMLLNDNFNGELDHWRVYASRQATRPTCPEFIAVLDDYVEYLNRCYSSENTIDFKKRCAAHCLANLEKAGITALKEIDHQCLSDYFASDHFTNREPDGVATEYGRVRMIIEYLEEKGLLSFMNLHCTVPKIRSATKQIVTTYNEEQKKVVLDNYPTFPANLRDKSICTLILQSGLRFCDVKAIKFDDIDWEKKEIHIVQKKTGVPLTVYMTPDIENAIVDYILNERRESDSRYIFIKATGPKSSIGRHRNLNTRKRFRAADTDTEPAEFGSHILRRTFASELLESGASMDVITAGLGHTDKSVVNKYLSTNSEKMKLCALSIEEYPYMGGLF